MDWSGSCPNASNEGQESLIIWSGMPFGIERDLPADNALILQTGMRLDHLALNAALDVVVAVRGDYHQRIVGWDAR
jgi:hypothetical protein